ncbi:ribosomal biogenesis regulatory protein [Rhizodiscina lignyota]|uniref:Ribosome biogenesis regulatory protein n=1 Tax=Rhizodiscina lignyota TaxID=1504668 RepID=A0A9P4I4F3_9PEZI|nr:ribosomal biogenesis regulatory protein [Rhizodiscina lignyota]
MAEMEIVDSPAAPEQNDMEVDAAETSGGVSLPASTSQRQPITVEKAIPYTFDLGHLLANDASPLPPNPSEELLTSTARDAAQSLINQLLTTCELNSTSDGIAIMLPTTSTPLPREKSVPAEKEPTKWERFAAKKGIKAKRNDERANKVYDEEKGEWVAKWGYKGKNKDGENNWLVEVDEKKERASGEAGDVRKENRQERKDRVKRNERRMRANEKRAGKAG